MSISFRRYRGRSGKHPRNGGFTLIELLIVMAIMVILTSVLLVKQSKFDSSTLLRSLAYSVGLSVRQAQVYGSSVFGTATAQANCTIGDYASGACYSSDYGLHFDSNTPSQYILFADLNGDGAYQSGESIKGYTLNNGYVISDFCAVLTAGGSHCVSAGTLTTLDIYFKRPNPDALFNGNAGSSYNSASIQIKNIGDSANTRMVCVYQTGQIAIEPVNAACP